MVNYSHDLDLRLPSHAHTLTRVRVLARDAFLAIEAIWPGASRRLVPSPRARLAEVIFVDVITIPVVDIETYALLPIGTPVRLPPQPAPASVIPKNCIRYACLPDEPRLIKLIHGPPSRFCRVKNRLTLVSASSFEYAFELR